MLLLCGSALADDEPFAIDEYEFEWKVASFDESKVSIVKTEETTRVLISKPYDSFDMASADAKAVGTVLLTTPSYFKKLDSAAEASEVVEAGGCEVNFSKREGRFYVSILRSGISSGVISLDRKQATSIAPYLIKSPQMIAYFDKIIDGVLAAK